MDPRFPVKEEYPAIYSFSISWSPPHGVVEAVETPRPIEGLYDMGVPPFLTKTFDMVEDLSTDDIVSWSRGGQSFVVWDTHAFSTTVLPTYFKHSNFSSFVRQLNTYGFRKADLGKWEFENESFLKGQKHLLKNITRRKVPSQPLAIAQKSVGACLEAVQFGQNAKINWLRQDKQVLMTELFNLRQEQQNARVYLHEMDLRLQGTERNQQQTMNSLAKAMQNPDFIDQLVQNKEKGKEIEEVVNKKRQRPIEGVETSKVNKHLVKVGFEVSELEALALEMQGFGRGKREEEKEEQEREWLGSYGEELDAGFWEALLLNEGFDKETDMNKNDKDKDEENIDSCMF